MEKMKDTATTIMANIIGYGLVLAGCTAFVYFVGMLEKLI